MTTDDYFSSRVVLFSLPGAFTPTCSSRLNFQALKKSMLSVKTAHVDEVYCVSVNDAYVMNAW